MLLISFTLEVTLNMVEILVRITMLLGTTLALSSLTSDPSNDLCYEI